MIDIVEHEPDSIKDVLVIILSAYEHLQQIDDPMNESKDINYLYQFMIEKYNQHPEFKNVLVYMPHNMYPSSSIVNIVDLFIHYNRLIYKSSVSSVVNNMYVHYNHSTISSIIGDSKIVKSSNRSMSMVNMSQDITSIYNIYHNDMNLIITDFYKYGKLSEFVDMIEAIRTHTTSDGIVMFNYVVSDQDSLLKFMFDIDERIDDVNEFDDQKSQMIEVRRFNKDDSKVLNRRIKQARTLVKTHSLLERPGINVSHKIMDIDDEHVYLYDYGSNVKSQLYNYVRDYMINAFDQLKSTSDFLLPVLKALSKQLSFDMKVYYPYEDHQFQEKLTFDKQLSNVFTRDAEFYSNFV